MYDVKMDRFCADRPLGGQSRLLLPSIRKNTSMEDSNAMTIEFLRARLLSERSVSKTARQRADELSKRVSELEEQLKFVSLQRKKAEKATADVLAILENHGISDVSEGYDSNSDHEETLHGSMTDSLMTKDTSTNLEVRRNEMESYSSSELESSASIGRSLSWKSTKDSQCSLEKKNYLDPVRRKYNFPLNGSSARRAGKSCRRIRRRETRSMEEFQNDSPVKATSSRDVYNGSDCNPESLRDHTEYDSEKQPIENLMLESGSGNRKINEHYISEHERDDDMESALKHQALLIVQFEEEEKAQREWEEKYRENNSGTQDSCDPNSHSDLTEEQEETKLPGFSDAAGKLSSDNLEMKGKLLETHFDEELETHQNFLLPPDAEKGLLQEQGCSHMITCEPPMLESSFPMLKENVDKENSRIDHEAPSLPIYCTTKHSSTNISTNAETIFTPNVSSSSSSSNSLPVVLQETSKDLGSVLGELQLAKSSLKQKITGSLPLAGGTSNTFRFPPSSPALFRLPTDYQFEATSTAKHPVIDAKSSFANFSPEIYGDKLYPKPYIDPRNALSDGTLLTFSSSPLIESWHGATPQRSLSYPRHSTGPPSHNILNHTAPYTNTVPPVKDSHPFLPDITLQFPLSDGTSRSLSSSETSVHPVACFSSYDESFRQYMSR
ncbi:uncharacterized protein [Henckelia pumila]|uniref:uncharacterized protein isoform X2 n=1 Tax=Henckelia pumila TaxID=405737 RepID=UPI003C6DBE99